MELHRAISAALTVVLHSTMLWSCAVATAVPPPPASTPVEQEAEPLQVRLLPSEEGDGAACDSYRGIGVLHGWGGIIKEVAQGGPADKAGVRVGDRFVNVDDFGGNRYPLGAVLTMRLVRDDRPLELRVVIGNICTEVGR